MALLGWQLDLHLCSLAETTKSSTGGSRKAAEGRGRRKEKGEERYRSKIKISWHRK